MVLAHPSGVVGARGHHVDRWERGRRRAVLTEWTLVLGFFAVVAVLLGATVSVLRVP